MDLLDDFGREGIATAHWRLLPPSPTAHSGIVGLQLIDGRMVEAPILYQDLETYLAGPPQ